MTGKPETDDYRKCRAAEMVIWVISDGVIATGKLCPPIPGDTTVF
jgi:hypothetical protein